MLWERPDFIEIKLNPELNHDLRNGKNDLIVPWRILQPLDNPNRKNNNRRRVVTIS